MCSLQINCYNSITLARRTSVFLSSIHQKSTSISPDSCADNISIVSPEWIYIILLHPAPQCTDKIPIWWNYTHMSTVSVSFEGYNVSAPSAWVLNGFIAISVLDILWIRICPFVCTYWSSAELRQRPKILTYF